MRVEGLGFRQGLGSRVLGLGFEVYPRVRATRSGKSFPGMFRRDAATGFMV